MLFEINSFLSKFAPQPVSKDLCLYHLLDGRIVSRERSIYVSVPDGFCIDRESATAKAVYLINCLYNKNKQVGMNLTGNSSKNQPRKEMDADIRDSIIGMVSIMTLVILFCMKLEINFS